MEMRPNVKYPVQTEEGINVLRCLLSEAQSASFDTMPEPPTMPPEHRTDAIRKRPTTLGGTDIASLGISGALVLAYGLFGRWGEAQPDVFVSYWHQLLQASPLCFAFMLVAA